MILSGAQKERHLACTRNTTPSDSSVCRFTKFSLAALQVIWVDLLTKSEFEAGFGSHTPMYSGQTKCVRYYMNFQRALRLLKEILLKVGQPACRSDCVQGRPEQRDHASCFANGTHLPCLFTDPSE